MGLLAYAKSLFYRPGESAHVEKGFNDMDDRGWSHTGTPDGMVSLKTRAVLNRSLTPVECFELSGSVRRASDAMIEPTSVAPV